MPKVKTHSGAKKRFSLTATGKLKFQKAGRRHLLTKKTIKRKRHLRKPSFVDDTNLDFVQRLLRLK